jgi:hypothetical protein
MNQFKIITPDEIKISALCENTGCKLIEADRGVCFKL